MTADNVTPQKLADELVSWTRDAAGQLLTAMTNEKDIHDPDNEELFGLLHELSYVVEELDWFDGKPITLVRHVRAQHAGRNEGLMHVLNWCDNGVPESTAIEGLRIAMMDIRSDREFEHLVRLLHSEHEILRTGAIKQWWAQLDERSRTEWEDQMRAHGWTPPKQKD